MPLRQKTQGSLMVFQQSTVSFLSSVQSLAYLLCEKWGLLRCKAKQEHVHRVSLAERGLRGATGWVLAAVNPRDVMVPLVSAALWLSARLNKSKQIWKECSNWQELMKRDFSQERQAYMGSISGLQRQMRSCVVLSHSYLSILSWLDFCIF